jgi:hypothetical protein
VPRGPYSGAPRRSALPTGRNRSRTPFSFAIAFTALSNDNQFIV